MTARLPFLIFVFSLQRSCCVPPFTVSIRFFPIANHQISVSFPQQTVATAYYMDFFIIIYHNCRRISTQTPRTVPKWELYGGKLFRFRPLRAYPAGLQLCTATMEGTESLYLLSFTVCAEHLLSGVLDVGLCGSVSIESAKQDHHCLYYYNIGASHKTIGIFRLEVITL